MSDLGEHNGEGIRYKMHLSAPAGGIAQMLCDPEGHWVGWEDYVRLKAEVKRLGIERISDLGMLGEMSAENTRLKAEIERLRNAGDDLACALAAFHVIHRGSIDSTKQEDIVKWNAAKEGKPSA